MTTNEPEPNAWRAMWGLLPTWSSHPTEDAALTAAEDVARETGQVCDGCQSGGGLGMSDASEAYCVDSGRPVSPMGGDRCKSHGAAGTPCYVAFRAPRCEHPDWPRWANGSDRCPECRAVVTTEGGADE